MLDVDLPLVGPLAEVAAGTPILCEANIVERLPAAIAERFRPRADYLLTVRGDSMNRTGLCEGDIAAIHRTRSTESGQVVVARFGDEVTLKDTGVNYLAASQRGGNGIVGQCLAKVGKSISITGLSASCGSTIGTSNCAPRATIRLTRS